MNKFLSGLMATALVGSFAIASVIPANTAPVYVPKSSQAQTDVEKVNHTRRHARIQQQRRAFRADRYDNRADKSRYREDRYDHSAYRKHHRRHWRDYNNNSYRRDGYYRRDGGVRLELNF